MRSSLVWNVLVVCSLLSVGSAQAGENVRTLFAAVKALELSVKVRFHPSRMERLLPLVLADVPESDIQLHLLEDSGVLIGSESGDAEPVLFVNGAGISFSAASEESQALAKQLQRPVRLFYNETEGMLRDVVEAAGDRFGPVSFSPNHLRFNSTSRRLAHYLVSSEGPVAIVSHSQGSILVRNALLIADRLRPLSDDVAWVATGMPLNQAEIFPQPCRFLALTNADDIAAKLLADLSVVDIRMLSVLGSDRHDFRANYLDKIPAEAL